MQDRCVPSGPSRADQPRTDRDKPRRPGSTLAGLLDLQASAGNAAVTALVGSPPLQRQGFGELRVAEGRQQQRLAERRQRTIRYFSRIQDKQLRAAYVSRLRLYLADKEAGKEYWDLEVMEQIVTARAPKADWHAEKQAFEDRRLGQDRNRRMQTLPWHQRVQLESIDARTSGWSGEEQTLARDLLWRWIDLQLAKRPVAEIKVEVAGLVHRTYERWLRAVDEQRLAWFRSGPSTRALIRARASGEKPGVSWFADDNQPGPLRLYDLAATSRLVAAGDQIAPIDAVTVWVREYRKRTNRQLLEQEEYLGKVLTVVNLGATARAGVGSPRPAGASPPAGSPRPTGRPELPATSQPPVATGNPASFPSSTSPPTRRPAARGQEMDPDSDPGKSRGRAGREEPQEAKRPRPAKEEKNQEIEQTKLSAQQYTAQRAKRWPGRDPDIGVLEIRDDGALPVVLANRADVQAKTGTNTHQALAQHADGLGPPTGGRRYRMYLDRSGKATNVQPLDHATQTPDLLQPIEQALRYNKLLSPTGTIVDLSGGKGDASLRTVLIGR